MSRKRVKPTPSRKKPAKNSNDSKSYGDKIRLNKFIANAGVCSRRQADELIEQGKIRVNGKVVSELGYRVNPSDKVEFDNKILRGEKPIYILLNKPKSFITTVKDPEGRKTVLDLVKIRTGERIFPVGRLDRNTTGLLLLTNDGELAEKLTHPSYEIPKVYQVELNKPVTEEHFNALVEGIRLDDGPVKPDEIVVLTAERKSIGLEIHSGRNRIIRRMFEHLGYDVVKLDRMMYAGLTKKNLPRGKWRKLTEKEVIRLKHLT